MERNALTSDQQEGITYVRSMFMAIEAITTIDSNGKCKHITCYLNIKCAVTEKNIF